ncbi:MAG TPA: TIGR02530 family flagellar biosynthesis protein [Syntrophomonadaceae bacterium]|nr:TIGR02530 family flagellar biosynthesis protein [Syntrophomonadaceae bacterium]
MDSRIRFTQQTVQPLGSSKPAAGNSGDKTGVSTFQSLLEQKLNNTVQFSRHAQERLQSRNINLDAEDMDKLNQAVSQARDKGARDSLILMKDLALVVSVKNNTVITAVDGNSLRDNVFTNIDSAVII